MKTAIILHGMPSREEYFNPDTKSQSNAHWLPWLQKNLTINGVLAQTPEMPAPYHPDYKAWTALFEQFTINEDTLLIGHSLGGGFLVRWLSENKVRVGKVVLVAPWIDPDHEETESVGDFFDFEIDPQLADRTVGITAFISNDDQPMIKTVTLLEEKIKNLTVKRIEDKGHFTLGEMGTEEFPELLREVLQ
jgi:predicted alpha/beta hydrolase family esterase